MTYKDEQPVLTLKIPSTNNNLLIITILIMYC